MKFSAIRALDTFKNDSLAICAARIISDSFNTWVEAIYILTTRTYYIISSALRMLLLQYLHDSPGCGDAFGGSRTAGPRLLHHRSGVVHTIYYNIYGTHDNVHPSFWVRVGVVKAASYNHVVATGVASTSPSGAHCTRTQEERARLAFPRICRRRGNPVPCRRETARAVESASDVSLGRVGSDRAATALYYRPNP